MLKKNITTLRTLKGYSQEQVAEKIGVSRQAYAKWERGETVPDVDRCQKIAELYGVTIDSLVNFSAKLGKVELAPGPKGKHFFGITVVNDRGQIVIPKKAREVFEIKCGDSVVILGDEEAGIALIKADLLEKRLCDILSMMKQDASE